jgi:hypothetical protein
MGLALVSYSRGYVTELAKWGEPYWVINYHDGLVRRALVGEVFSWLFNQNDLQRVRLAALSVHFTACMMLLFGIWLWVRRLSEQSQSETILALFALFIGSQFLPRLAHDTGYLDVYVYGLVLVALACAAVEAWGPIVAIGLIGPFLYEGFLFIWLTFVVLFLWERMSRARLLLCALPLIPAALLYLGVSETAGVAQMASAPLTPDVKAEMLEYQFGHTFARTVYIMQWKFRHHFDNFLVAAAFFGYPSALICGVYGYAWHNLRDMLALVLATLAPATILVLGWDLSRFLLVTAFSGLISVLYMSTLRPAPKIAASLIAVCWLAATVGFLTPHVYAFFDIADIADHGVLPLSQTALGRAVASGTRLYTWGTDPFVPDPGASATDPPGQIWHVEEEAWVDVWTRQPRTNVFDVVASLGKATIRYEVTVVQIGDIIRVSRRMGDGSEMIYSGRLRGRRIKGRFIGGAWFATIE